MTEPQFHKYQFVLIMPDKVRAQIVDEPKIMKNGIRYDIFTAKGSGKRFESELRTVPTEELTPIDPPQYKMGDKVHHLNRQCEITGVEWKYVNDDYQYRLHCKVDEKMMHDGLAFERELKPVAKETAKSDALAATNAPQNVPQENSFVYLVKDWKQRKQGKQAQFRGQEEDGRYNVAFDDGYTTEIVSIAADYFSTKNPNATVKETVSKKSQTVDEAIQEMFEDLSNAELIKAYNKKVRLKKNTDDEFYEIERRKTESAGSFDYEMEYEGFITDKSNALAATPSISDLKNIVSGIGFSNVIQFKVGNEVEVIDEDSEYYGESGIIKNINAKTQHYSVEINGKLISGFQADELDIAPNAPLYKVGDKVKMLDGKAANQVGTIIKLDDEIGHGEWFYKIMTDGGEVGYYETKLVSVTATPSVETGKNASLQLTEEEIEFWKQNFLEAKGVGNIDDIFLIMPFKEYENNSSFKYVQRYRVIDRNLGKISYETDSKEDAEKWLEVEGQKRFGDKYKVAIDEFNNYRDTVTQKFVEYKKEEYKKSLAATPTVQATTPTPTPKDYEVGEWYERTGNNQYYYIFAKLEIGFNMYEFLYVDYDKGIWTPKISYRKRKDFLGSDLTKITAKQLPKPLIQELKGGKYDYLFNDEHDVEALTATQKSNIAQHKRIFALLDEPTQDIFNRYKSQGGLKSVYDFYNAVGKEGVYDAVSNELSALQSDNIQKRVEDKPEPMTFAYGDILKGKKGYSIEGELFEVRTATSPVYDDDLIEVKAVSKPNEDSFYLRYDQVTKVNTPKLAKKEEATPSVITPKPIGVKSKVEVGEIVFWVDNENGSDAMFVTSVRYSNPYFTDVRTNLYGKPQPANRFTRANNDNIDIVPKSPRYKKGEYVIVGGEVYPALVLNVMWSKIHMSNLYCLKVDVLNTIYVLVEKDIKQSLEALPPVVAPENYQYAMKHRGFGIGTYPKDGFVKFVKEGSISKDGYYALLEYDKKLSKEDVENFELEEYGATKSDALAEKYDTAIQQIYKDHGAWKNLDISAFGTLYGVNGNELEKRYMSKYPQMFDKKYYAAPRSVPTPVAAPKEDFMIDFDQQKAQFIADLKERFEKNAKTDGYYINRLLKKLNIDDKNIAYEWAELAWIEHYRTIIDRGYKSKFKQTIFDRVQEFYTDVQPRFSSNDSNKQKWQQYSTPAPLSLLAGWFCDANTASSVFEPSAGNGLMTIYAPQSVCTVNEIDMIRVDNLKSQPFKVVLNRDASEQFPEFKHKFDVVLSNPPFGTLVGEVNRDYEYGFKKLDFVMVAHALETMKNDGRAALIIGGNMVASHEVAKKISRQAGLSWCDDNGRITSSRPFWVWLFRNYNVVDIINVDGDLYSKQGTNYPVRMILIDGRNKSIQPPASVGTHPHFFDKPKDWNEIYERVESAKKVAETNNPKTLQETGLRILKQLEIALLSLKN